MRRVSPRLSIPRSAIGYRSSRLHSLARVVLLPVVYILVSRFAFAYAPQNDALWNGAVAGPHGLKKALPGYDSRVRRSVLDRTSDNAQSTAEMPAWIPQTGPNPS